MRDRFERQLATLHGELIEMGKLCEEAILAAIEAVFGEAGSDGALGETGAAGALGKAGPDGAFHEAVAEGVRRAEELEVQIDQKERDIEAICMKLLLQQQPVARDLLTISSALKMISDMERIGDQAADIGEIAKSIDRSVTAGSGADGPSSTAAHLQEMADFAVKMVEGSIRAFVDEDLGLAKKVIADDDVVDGYFDQVKRDLIAGIGETSHGQLFLDVLMIAKYLERIGDHATNIAEWVVYSMTGSKPEG
jgi:phosphate transport system protein